MNCAPLVYRMSCVTNGVHFKRSVALFFAFLTDLNDIQTESRFIRQRDWRIPEDGLVALCYLTFAMPPVVAAL